MVAGGYCHQVPRCLLAETASAPKRVTGGMGTGRRREGGLVCQVCVNPVVRQTNWMKPPAAWTDGDCVRLTYDEGRRKGGGGEEEQAESGGRGRAGGRGSEGDTERTEKEGDEKERGQEPKGENRGRGGSLISQH